MTNRKNDIIQEAIKKAKRESVMGKLGDSPYEDPMEPWSGKYQSPVKEELIVEVNTMLLFRYIKAQGYNPEFMTFAQRSSYARSNAFKRWKEEHKEDQLPTQEEVENLDEAEVEEMSGANMNTRAVHQHLKGLGWKLTRSSGGHDIFTHPESDKSIPVPRHKQLKAPLVLGIMKTSKIKAKELDEAGTGLLMSYIKAKGLNPLSMDGNQKSAYSRSSEFQQYKSKRVSESLSELKELYGMKGLSDLIINQQELSELSGMGERGDDWNESAGGKLSMPLKGHDYHKKSDAELRYIQKDAAEAAKAMQGHAPKSEAKYLDQVNDASTVLHYRSKGGKQLAKESVESIDEGNITHILSKELVSDHKRWMDSEGFDTKTKPLPKSHPKHATHVGIVSKNNKESSYHEDGFARPIHESVESIDELSKNTVTSYALKAGTKLGGNIAALGASKDISKYSANPTSPDEVKKRLNKSITNRTAGLAAASQRLSKEEVEPIDELSKGTLMSYVKKGEKQQGKNFDDIIAAHKGNDQTKANKANAKYLKRNAGLDRAVDKMYSKYDKKTEEVEELDEISTAQMSHQGKTTLKHIKNPGVGLRMAAHDIKPGIKGYRDRVDLMRAADAEGKLKKEADNLTLRGLHTANPQSIPSYMRSTEKGKKSLADKNKTILKDLIKRQLGKHPKPNLPEEVEELDELSKSTVRSYANKKSAELSHVPLMPFKRKPMSDRENRNAERGMMGALRRLNKEEVDKTDTITLDIPLMIRVLEYAREDAKTDMDLHKVVENLINLRGEGPLSMDHYEEIVNIRSNVKESSELDEASYGIGGYTRGFDRSKQRFKSNELSKELGHEVGSRTPMNPVEEPHAVHINGKKWKTFGSKSHATNVATSLANKVSGVTVVKEENLTEFKKQPDNMDADDHITREGIYGIEDSPMSATNSVKAMENSGCKKKMSNAAKMIKSIYKKNGVSESTYDWEKENKGTNGKEVTAKITLTGGKTMTGKDRDTVEIEPVMKTKTKNTAGMKTGD